MSNVNENQKEKTFFVKQFVKGNKNNTGSILQLNISKKNGEMLITIAPQQGMDGKLPRFDYNKKSIFNLSEEEIIQTLDLYKSKKEGEVAFRHLNANNPKTIVFRNSIYNGEIQFSLFVKQNDTGITFFFNSVEARVFLKNLEDSISMYSKILAVLALNNIE